MRIAIVVAALAVVSMIAGCSSDAKPDNSAQINKVQQLEKASKASQAKDGIKSEG